MLKGYHGKSDLTKAYIQMHVSIVLWGLTGVLGRAIDLNEGLLVWYRLIIASFSLFLFIQWKGISLKVTKEQFKALVGIGVLLMVHWICFYGAIKYSNISVTLSVFSSTTLFTALVEPLVTGKKFDKSEILYSLMAMAGIAVIFYSDSNSYTIGIILALLAAFIGVFFNILNKTIVNKVSSEVVSFYEIFSGLVVLTPLLPIYLHYFPTDKIFPTISDWTLLAILAVVCTHITLILSLNALKHLSAFTLNLSINLEPIYGITLAFLIFKENKQLGMGFFIGTAIIMASVVLHAYFESKKNKKDMPQVL